MVYEYPADNVYISRMMTKMPHTIENESMLALAASNGDRAALEKLLQRNWMWLKGMVIAGIYRFDAIDDILQEICIKVIDKIDTLKEPERFKPWLATIARREIVNFRREQKKQTQLLNQVQQEVELPDRPSLNQEHWTQETCESILDALKRLPEKYREVFVLKYIKDYSYAEIAEALDIPFTTVQIRLTRSRRMIYDIVKERMRNRNNHR
ncbi:MAG TPA: RNA polymerase sigma factor [Phycisphaerales bacterium]|nr:RNA polymerase sigma factor [Phycisphaerales bacterium]